MNRSSKFALFFVLGLALVFSPHASFAYYASVPTTNKYSTTIAPSKKSFSTGETITLSGHVSPYEQGRELQIIVRDSASDIVVLKTAQVSSDGTFSYDITDTTQWKKGNYKVAAQYGYDDVDIGTASFSFEPASESDTTTESAQSAEMSIPSWIKSNAKFWSDGTITDKDCVSGIQYMIKQGIIKIPKTSPAKTTSDQIPEWVKSNAKWWSDGTIGDKDFVSGLQFLIGQGIIKV